MKVSFVMSLCAATFAAHILLEGSQAQAQPTPPANPNQHLTAEVVAELRSILANPIVERSIKAQNAKYGDLPSEAIDRLDKQWRAERKADDKPLIAMTLSNPLSSYLTRMQADNLGLYAAIFIMDRNGLNVGQSAITGDFWQGDEAKFQKTFPAGGEAVFVDEPEWVEDFNIWITQVNLSVADSATGEPIGAATFDVNLAELARRARAINSN